MQSKAYTNFSTSIIQADILYALPKGAHSINDQENVEQACFKAAIAYAVGCWEGYVEEALKEFVAKTRIAAKSRRSWHLISQFEYMVNKMTSELNTPSWDKVRELMLSVAGIDPNPSWVFEPLFANNQATKEFFDGLMKVRHSFAHGFSIPNDLSELKKKGVLDEDYVEKSILCLKHLVKKTDQLLEHELLHRHNCYEGW